MAGVWTIDLGFGEIPVLANSAKVSVSAGYQFNSYVHLGGIVQFPDLIERGSESLIAIAFSAWLWGTLGEHRRR
jgi:hypothetical protein